MRWSLHTGTALMPIGRGRVHDLGGLWEPCRVAGLSRLAPTVYPMGCRAIGREVYVRRSVIQAGAGSKGKLSRTSRLQGSVESHSSDIVL